jgi:hypothetical protein
MSDLDPMAQVQVEEKILILSRQLTQVTEEVADALMEAAQADAAYDLAKAKALLYGGPQTENAALRGETGRKGTVPEKQAAALIAVENLFIRAKTTEAVAKASLEAGRNLRANLDALRSLNTNIRDRVLHAAGRGG